jgi:hypothetical protein
LGLSNLSNIRFQARYKSSLGIKVSYFPQIGVGLMLEKTEQKIIGATIGLVGVIVGGLVFSIASHKGGPGATGEVGINAGGGVKDTPIVMEGGSIVLDSDTPWTCTLDQTSQITTCTTTLAGSGQWVRRIRVVELNETTEKLVVPGIAVSDTWTMTFYTTASTPEQEVMSGTGSVITVTTSANAKTMLSDMVGTSGKELTIFPYDSGNYTNKVNLISVTNVNAAGTVTPYGPVPCASTTAGVLELSRCFVHFKLKDQ